MSVLSEEMLANLMNVDFSFLVKVMMPIIILNISSNIAGKKYLKYKLQKDFKPTDISKITLPPKLDQKYSEVDIEKLVEFEYLEILISFVNYIEENFSNCDLTNFYNNINELKTKEKEFILTELLTIKTPGGTYKSKSNVISLHKDLSFESINPILFHELFHMASSVYDNGISYIGFSQKNHKEGTWRIGDGINEGYTELLRRRACDEKKELTTINYNVSVEIVKRLEEIVGKDRMQQLYFKADLPGLIKELEKYSTEDEIAQFISGTDFIYNKLEFRNIDDNIIEMIRESFKNVYEYMFKALVRKEKLNYEDGLIDEKELVKIIADKVMKYEKDHYIDYKYYICITRDTMKEIVKSTLGEDFMKKVNEENENSYPFWGI